MKLMKKCLALAIMIAGLNVAHAANCGGLSAVEQSFASGMSQMNKDMFCSQFSQSMRDSAMNMSGMPDSNGNMMTPDQAVEKVAKDNNLMPMSGSSGGCAVH